jgi:hypothetical protein
VLARHLPPVCGYVDRMPPPKKRSLQDVLRERRAAAPLLNARELRERELARNREELERAAAALVDRRRELGTAVDAGERLTPELYRAVFAADASAYFTSKHWSRRSRAQRAAAPACEVERCGRVEELHVHLLDRGAVGLEEPGRDVITLCDSCRRRAVKLEQELGRLPTHAELRRLDPHRPLFTPAEIAALKAKHRRPLRPPARR